LQGYSLKCATMLLIHPGTFLSCISINYGEQIFFSFDVPARLLIVRLQLIHSEECSKLYTFTRIADTASRTMLLTGIVIDAGIHITRCAILAYNCSRNKSLPAYSCESQKTSFYSENHYIKTCC
jgi:hypothetical protein